MSDTNQYVFCNWDIGPYHMVLDYGMLEMIYLTKEAF
jgi:hypothetical protein